MKMDNKNRKKKNEKQTNKLMLYSVYLEMFIIMCNRELKSGDKPKSR